MAHRKNRGQTPIPETGVCPRFPLLLAAAVLACWDASPEQGPPADPVHLQPGAFVLLSGDIRDDLLRRGCSIPQSYPDSTPHNVVQGRFTSPEQVDVAVLCATDSTTSILVFRGGLVSSVAELAIQPHADEQPDPASPFWHSRAIGTADSSYIRLRFERYGGPRPPRIDHEGINDIFIEKASVVWYWHQGQWLQLQGAD